MATFPRCESTCTRENCGPSSARTGCNDSLPRSARPRRHAQRLAARQLPENLIQPFRIEQKNVASAEKVSGAIIGGLVPYFIIILCLSGAMYPAMDLTAGEKERGTIETILSSPVSRVHLVLGKFFMVLTAALFTALLAMASLGLTFAAGKSMLAGTPQLSDLDFTASISVKALALVFVMIMPLAVLFLRGAAGHLALRQELSGGAKLSLAADHHRDAARDRVGAARR